MQPSKTKSIFFDQFNITAGDLEAYLSEALSAAAITPIYILNTVSITRSFSRNRSSRALRKA
jgi:hypothetical protein